MKIQFLSKRVYTLFILGFFSLILFTGCNNDAIDNAPPDIIITKDIVPKISIQTNGATIVDEPKIDAQMSISIGDVINYEGTVGIEFRGASSQSFPKKSYGVETRDQNNNDLDVSLLGFPEEEDWILYGPYSDKSLMRNILVYDLARDIDMYASRSIFTELKINNKDQGVYIFMEKLKRDTQRINVSTLTLDQNSGEELTGGYILKIDKISGSNLGDGYNNFNSFSSSHSPPNASYDQKINFLYEYPDAEVITAQQKIYISSYIKDFENALASADFKDPNIGYSKYIDVPSFIDFFLLNEISNNVDGYRLSTYMHKDRSGKLKMGPVWDFNLALGNADYCGGGETNLWAYKFNERCSQDYWLIPFWWERLLQDPAFVSQLKNRWITLRNGPFSEDSIMSKIIGYHETLENAGAIDKNFNIWKILGVYLWPNKFVGNTYIDENNYLSNWVLDRLTWMDGALNTL